MHLRNHLTMELARKELCLEDGPDLISQLPDSILHHILSKGDLGTQDVAQTCILSKRWRDIWASMPHLVFDYNNDWCPRTDIIGQTNIKFARFVNMMLLHHDTSDVQSFRLHWDNEDYRYVAEEGFFKYIPNYITRWMKYAIDRNVRELEIFANIDYESFEYPYCIFTSQFLEYLSLKIFYGNRDLPDLLNLCRLRRLELGGFTIRTVPLDALMSRCPFLLHIHFSSCKLQDPDISSNSLKILWMSCCDISGTRIRISSPNLQVLHLLSCKCDRTLEVLLENLPSLTYADIRINDYFEVNSKPHQFISPRSKGLSGNELSELQTFHNLKKLELRGYDTVKDFPAVEHFLQRSPNLELLTIVKDKIIGYVPFALLMGRITGQMTVKELFNCPHRKIYIMAQCADQSENILELVADFLNDKCGCFLK